MWIGYILPVAVAASQHREEEVAQVMFPMLVSTHQEARVAGVNDRLHFLYQGLDCAGQCPICLDDEIYGVSSRVTELCTEGGGVALLEIGCDFALEQTLRLLGGIEVSVDDDNQFHTAICAHGHDVYALPRLDGRAAIGVARRGVEPFKNAFQHRLPFC